MQVPGRSLPRASFQNFAKSISYNGDASEWHSTTMDSIRNIIRQRWTSEACISSPRPPNHGCQGPQWSRPARRRRPWPRGARFRAPLKKTRIPDDLTANLMGGHHTRKRTWYPKHHGRVPEVGLRFGGLKTQPIQDRGVTPRWVVGAGPW